MRHLLAMLALLGAVALGGPAWAQDAATGTAVATAVAQAPAAAAPRAIKRTAAGIVDGATVTPSLEEIGSWAADGGSTGLPDCPSFSAGA